MDLQRLLLLLAALWCCPGCLYVGGRASVGPSFDDALLAGLVPGESDKSDVLALLGPPGEFLKPELAVALLDDTSRFSGALEVARRAADVWTWQRDTLDADGTMLGLLTWIELEVDSDLVVVFFDRSGIVTHVARGKHRGTAMVAP